ncbi:hypothetical protein COCOBI_05-3980 [Coccomyxa sp. Obi]|nr:hypothetical protein COCOBI_05-3980 [Coccomyxa sp. Obi]
MAVMQLLQDWDRDQRLIDQTLDRCFQVWDSVVDGNVNLAGVQGMEGAGMEPTTRSPGSSAAGIDELAYLHEALPRSLIRNGFPTAAAAYTRDMADADLPSLWRAQAYKTLSELHKALADVEQIKRKHSGDTFLKQLLELSIDTRANSTASFTAERGAEATAKPGNRVAAGSSKAADLPRSTVMVGGVSHADLAEYSRGLSQEDAMMHAALASLGTARFRASPHYGTSKPAAGGATPAAPFTAGSSTRAAGSALPSVRPASHQTAAAAAALESRLKERAIPPPTAGLHLHTQMQNPDHPCAQVFERLSNMQISHPQSGKRGMEGAGMEPTIRSPGTVRGAPKAAPGRSAAGFDELAYLRDSIPHYLIMNSFPNAAAAFTRDTTDADLPSARALAVELWEAIVVVDKATRILSTPDIDGKHMEALRRRAQAYRTLGERHKSRADKERISNMHLGNTVVKKPKQLSELCNNIRANSNASFTANPGSGAAAGSSKAADLPRSIATAGGVSVIDVVAYNGGLSEKDAVENATLASLRTPRFHVTRHHGTRRPAAGAASALPSVKPVSCQEAAAAATSEARLKEGAIPPSTAGLHSCTPMQSSDRIYAQGYQRPSTLYKSRSQAAIDRAYALAMSKARGDLGSALPSVKPASCQTDAAATALEARLREREIPPLTDGLYSYTAMQSPDHIYAQAALNQAYALAMSKAQGALGERLT